MSGSNGSRYGYPHNPGGFYADAVQLGALGIFKSNNEHRSDNALKASGAHVARKNGAIGIAYNPIDTVVSISRTGKSIYGNSAEVRLLSSCRKVACGRCNARGYGAYSEEHVKNNYYTCARGEYCNLCGNPYM